MNPFSQGREAYSKNRKRALHAICYFLFAFGILALGYAGFVFADARAYQTLEIKKFEQAGRISEPHAPEEGDVLGEIQIHRLRLKAIVVQGDSPANLQRAVGHIANSPLPGELGNVALAGHRDTFFRLLRDIRPGDEIKLRTLGRDFLYRVESFEVVTPTDIGVLKPGTGNELTLLTCFPFHYVGPAPKRFVVHAREVDEGVRK